MPHEPSLPLPGPEALTHSAELTRAIAAEIGRTGWIDFARYMELALYAPGLGYYAAGATKLGGAGDLIETVRGFGYRLRAAGQSRSA